MERETKKVLIELEVYDDSVPPEEFVENMLKDLMKFGIWGDSSWGRKQICSYKILSEREFTFFWIGGDRETLVGTSPSDALNKAGYGQGAMKSLDFWTHGNGDEYIFENHIWTKKDE